MTLVAIHVLISLLALATGAVVVQGLLAGQSRSGWIAWFLATTALTCVSGLLLPFSAVTPAVAVGILTLVLVAVAAVAFFGAKAAGHWAAIFVISTVVTQYFNSLVLVAQAFKHVPALYQLAPKGTEPPVTVAQGIVLALFVGLGILAVRRLRANRSGEAHAPQGA
jgi:hypothetical protein